MEKQTLYIGSIPAIVWGKHTDKVYLYVHGQQGCKEEASFFSEIACSLGWQVLSIDLPGHGDRHKLDENDRFVPWEIIPELTSVMDYITTHWNTVALYANSIGAYVSMLAFPHIAFTKCLFVSPILHMEKLIYTMMKWANVEESQLQKNGMIQMEFGQTLSWEYLVYAKEHPIINWNHPTHILYGSLDTMSERTTVEQFAKQFRSQLHVEEGFEHWFHTPTQLQVLRTWEREHC